MHYIIGAGLPALAVLPVAVSGWLLGVRGGILCGIIATLLNIVLLNIVGQDGANSILTSGAPGSVAIIIIGGTAGWVRQLFKRVQNQAADLLHERECLARENMERQQVEETLRLYDRVLSATSHGIVIIDPHHVEYPIIYCNPAFEKLTEYAHAEILGRSVHFLAGPDTDKHALQRIATAIEQGIECQIVLKQYRASGVPFWSEVALSPVRNANDYVTHCIVLSVDVTQRYEVEETLRDSEQRLLLHVQQTPLAYIEWDLHFCVREWNPAAETIFGYTRTEALSQCGSFLLPEHASAPVHDVWRALLHHKGGKRNVNDNLTKDGRQITCEWYNTPLVNEQQEVVGVVSLAQDITDRKIAEAQLVRAALYDTLTGLPNRALLMERLGRALQRAQRQAHPSFAILFLDLDRFKTINDSLGHLVGDQLLVGVARRLEGCVRAGDTVARLSGDEFAVLLDEVQDVNDVTAVAERMLHELSIAFSLNDHGVVVSASIGITLGSQEATTAADMLRDADIAMYRAKGLGKGCYAIFDADMHVHALALMQLESDLRRAIECEEFVLHYQPILSLATGRIESCEALIRWQHPERGLLAPGEFIAVAEETGLIGTIGEWALRQACRQAHAWYIAGSPVRVSVNLSAQQLKHPDLGHVVARILEESLLAPHYLTLELTESSLFEYTATTLSTMQYLRSLGVSFSIDDFGTGYSSLSYLHRFPLSSLKVDRSFIRDITKNPQDAVLTETIINMAHSLHLSVVAEGVETEAQLLYLQDVGVDAVQGYLISRPVGVSELNLVLQRSCTALSNAVERLS